MQLEQVNTPGLEQNFDEFLSGSVLKSRHDDHVIRINISRNTLIALIFSLLLHALILSFAISKIQFDNAAASPPPRAMEVSLALPQPATAELKQVPEQVQEQASAETPIETVKKPVTKIEKPKIIATSPEPKPIDSNKPAIVVPQAPTTPGLASEPQQPKEQVAKEEPVTDMQSYVKAMQAKRNAFETYAATQNADAVARERGPSEEQMRNERIKRNFQNGTNGIFEITSLGARNATFAFRGWTNDFSASKIQFFEVEAKIGEDVRLVMIKRMIALIREHYQGDFNWESHRLKRVVVQSARLEDNAGLEDFLMMEFFGANYKNSY